MQTLQSQIGWCARAQWVLGSTMLLMILVFYVFGYRPAGARLATLRQDIEIKRRELKDNQSRTQIRPVVEQTVNERRRKLERFDKKLPKQQDFGQFYNDITFLGRQSDLSKCAVEPAAVPRRNDRVVELPIDLRFEGNFLNVFSFLRQIDQMQRLTRVQSLKVIAKGNTGQVEVQLSMNIYYAE
jgi:type IV pilus assembly protein PilO